MNTRITSPGRTMGLSEFASSLMLSTATPCNWATLLRLKSLVRILPSYSLASSISFMSTSRTVGKSSSTIWICTEAVFWRRCRMSRPRRPRLRFSESAEHELRDHNQAVEETGLGDVGDAAVDNDAGVEDLVTLLARLFAAEDPAERRQIEQV